MTALPGRYVVTELPAAALETVLVDIVGWQALALSTTGPHLVQCREEGGTPRLVDVDGSGGAIDSSTVYELRAWPGDPERPEERRWVSGIGHARVQLSPADDAADIPARRSTPCWSLPRAYRMIDGTGVLQTVEIFTTVDHGNVVYTDEVILARR